MKIIRLNKWGINYNIFFPSEWVYFFDRLKYERSIYTMIPLLFGKNVWNRF